MTNVVLTLLKVTELYILFAVGKLIISQLNHLHDLSSKLQLWSDCFESTVDTFCDLWQGHFPILSQLLDDEFNNPGKEVIFDWEWTESVSDDTLVILLSPSFRFNAFSITETVDWLTLKGLLIEPIPVLLLFVSKEAEDEVLVEWVTEAKSWRLAAKRSRKEFCLALAASTESKAEFSIGTEAGVGLCDIFDISTWRLRIKCSKCVSEQKHI